jgi:hypothetical protein
MAGTQKLTRLGSGSFRTISYKRERLWRSPIAERAQLSAVDSYLKHADFCCVAHESVQEFALFSQAPTG